MEKMIFWFSGEDDSGKTIFYSEEFEHKYGKYFCPFLRTYQHQDIMREQGYIYGDIKIKLSINEFQKVLMALQEDGYELIFLRVRKKGEFYGIIGPIRDI